MESVRGIGLILRKASFSKWVFGILLFSYYIEFYFYNPKAPKLRHKILHIAKYPKDQLDYGYDQGFISFNYFIGILGKVFIEEN